MSENIEVIEVKNYTVEIRVLSIHFIFASAENGRVHLVARFKPYAQIYDPASNRVPKPLFKEACRIAAARLKSQQKRSVPIKHLRQIKMWG
ncbi:MAG: hypothetical protein HY764_03780 [Candidatus Portnoybacteria bacterium]|nr:hypothetical protein [Candidatus Portnoybacteria bacterium]